MMNRRRYLLALTAALWLAPTPAPAAEDGEAPPRPEYFTLDPLVVPVIHGGRLRGRIALAVTLELEPDADREKVRKVLARLRDRYLIDLKAYLDRHPEVARRVDLKAIKRVLARSSDRILGANVVRAILIQGAAARRE